MLFILFFVSHFFRFHRSYFVMIRKKSRLTCGWRTCFFGLFPGGSSFGSVFTFIFGSLFAVLPVSAPPGGHDDNDDVTIPHIYPFLFILSLLGFAFCFPLLLPTGYLFGAFLSVFLLVLLLMKKVLFRGLINSHHPVLFDFFGLTHPLRG